MNSIIDFFANWRSSFELLDQLVHANAWTAIGVSIAFVFFAIVAHYDHKLRGALPWRFLMLIAQFVKWIPPVNKYLKSALDDAQEQINSQVHKKDSASDWVRRIPEKGQDATQVIANIIRYRTLENCGSSKRDKPDYLEGAVSGAVFNTEVNHQEINLLEKVFSLEAYSNPLWPAIFPEVRRMEAEVVEMTKELLHGNADVCGTMTAGGSMSILQACLAYRNRAFDAGINFPEMVLPTSAHAAFFKAAELFRIRLVEIKVEDTDYVVDPKRVKKAINRNTCMIVGSVPNYPYGTCDDIEALGKIAIRSGVPLHVDACCGGFLVPFFDQDDAIPRFDFRVAGVSSISADTHKYGLAPKGSSVILFKDKSLRAEGFYSNTTWCGGIYASPTIEGSRNGSAIAVTWASLIFNGKETLRRSAASVRSVTRDLRDKISELPGMELMGRGDICIVAWKNTKICDYKLLDLVEKDGFILSPLQFPKGGHLMVTPLHGKDGYVDRLVESMRVGIKYLLENPDAETGGNAAMYGMTIAIPDRSIVANLTNIYLKTLYDFPPASSTDNAEKPVIDQAAVDDLHRQARLLLGDDPSTHLSPACQLTNVINKEKYETATKTEINHNEPLHKDAECDSHSKTEEAMAETKPLLK